MRADGQTYALITILRNSVRERSDMWRKERNCRTRVHAETWSSKQRWLSLVRLPSVPVVVSEAGSGLAATESEVCIHSPPAVRSRSPLVPAGHKCAACCRGRAELCWQTRYPRLTVSHYYYHYY